MGGGNCGGGVSEAAMRHEKNEMEGGVGGGREGVVS